MYGNGYELSPGAVGSAKATSPALLEWDWDIEHADRELERKADAAFHGTIPFQVDRRVLKDVVRENMGVDVGRITFLSSGEFNYLEPSYIC